jgi:hypothetical protein
LVACGFLVGAHPGHLCHDEAEQDLCKSLNLEENFPFQLSACTVTIPTAPGSVEKFSFQAVVVESPVKHARQLREMFYSLPKPAVSYKSFPYTGPTSYAH